MKKILLILSVASLFVACNSTRNSSPQEESPQYRFDIYLEGQLQPSSIEEDFEAYKLKGEGRSSRSQNRWIFTYDHSTIGWKALLEKIEAHPDVIEATAYPVNTKN